MIRPIALTLCALTSVAAASEIHDHDEHRELMQSSEKPANISINTHLSASFALGDSSGNVAYLEEAGHHNPQHQGFTMQALEIGSTLQLGQVFSSTAVYNQQWDRDDNGDGHWEEAYMTWQILPSLSIVTGSYLAHVSIENSQHAHSRSFVDSSIAHHRSLGEDGLIMQGLALHHQWGGKGQHSLNIGLGQAQKHEHGELEHFAEPLIHAHESNAEREIIHARLASSWQGYHWGLAAMTGENSFGRRTWFAAADLSHDVTLLGKPACYSAQASYRHAEAEEELSATLTTFDESAMSLMLQWQLSDTVTTNTRLEWISGSDRTELIERTRLSTNVSYQHALTEQIDSLARLQYNLDFLPGNEKENTLWLQVVIEFGSGH